jgi:hypothetical protein
MRVRYGATIFFVGLTIVATTLGITRIFAQAVDEQTPPPRPEWIDADGKLKPGAGPREISVAGRDGKNLLDASGSARKVPSYFDTMPTPPVRGGDYQETP